MSKVGILYDNISGNTGDVAIGLSLKKILYKIGVEFDVLFPGNFNPHDYETIIIGGGHLIRPSPDFFYDKFKVPGPHVLNAVGILDSPQDLHYLEDYSYLTVRSSWDKEKLSYIKKDVHVVPCTTMLLEDLENIPVELDGPSLGIHLLPHTFDEAQEEKFVEWISNLPFKIYFIPITHYNQDYIYMMRISAKVKNSVLLPIMKPLEIFTLMGKFDYFIGCSLHGGIFAYIHNVPFILYNYNEKMFFFMKDRGLDRFTFTNLDEMMAAFNLLLKEKPDYFKEISKDRDILKEHINHLKEILPSGDPCNATIPVDASQQNGQISNLQSQSIRLESQLLACESRITSLNRQLEEANARSKRLETQLNIYESRISTLSNQLQEAIIHSHELAEIKKGIIWRLTMRFHKDFVERMLPQGSKRRNSYDLGLSGGRILIDEGWRNLWHKYKERKSSIGFGPDLDQLYTSWINSYDKITGLDINAIHKRIEMLDYKPTISIIMPVYNTKEKLLRLAIESVRQQIYPNWELCIVDDASDKGSIRKIMEEYAHGDKRIKIHFRTENGSISVASDDAIKLATGEFIGFLDHDDEISIHAIYLVAEELNLHPEADLIYSDQDKINEDGVRYDPYFKPEFNFDLLRSQNYIDHFAVYRASLIRQLGGLRTGFDGSQDYDLVLRACDASSPAKIFHIPQVLYHWRATPGSIALNPDEKTYAPTASRKALIDHLQRNGIDARVESPFPKLSVHRVIYPLPEKLPLVSVIVPTKDGLEYLSRCLDGVLKRTDYLNLEIIIVDNQSEKPETLAFFEEIKGNDARVKVLSYDKSFNYPAINNMAVERSSGELICFLNNDIEIINSGWLHEMVSHAMRSDIGAVGAKLYYPNDTIQHAGVFLGYRGLAGHVYRYMPRYWSGHWARASLIQNFSAVTAACMVMRRKVFDEARGFDEMNLPIVFNDIDLCLRIREMGYRNLFTPYAELYHWESVTRGVLAYQSEEEYFKMRWRDIILNDTCYNPNLTLEKEDLSYAFPPRTRMPWNEIPNSLSVCSNVEKTK